ncbi:MAG TPA: hypothetical protein VLK33_13440 [Terriglobales bacterium]|nr:hypothetical protein [Terriglobales bacterium]
MPRIFYIAAILCLVISGDACKETPHSSGQVEPRLLVGPPAAVFDLKSAHGSDASGVQIYECVYQERDKTTRFRLQLKQLEPASGDIPMASAEGILQAVNGSDNSLFLDRLKIALDAKTIPTKSPRVTELPFDAMIIGIKQSRNSDGSYSSKPAGDWSAIKLFFPKGGDDGEVFLNLNPVLGKGEFSIKDSDYGDYLLQEFAKVL